MILKLLACLMIISLFIYNKLTAYENQISSKYSKVFGIIKSILKPILDLLSSFLKPIEIGRNLFLDATQIVLLILLLLILMR